jgi:hypothetical protein
MIGKFTAVSDGREREEEDEDLPVEEHGRAGIVD